MSGKAWMSSMKSNHAIFNKPGLRSKFFGEDWEPDSHELGVPNDKLMVTLGKYSKGMRLQRDEMIEAAAVFDEKRFKRTHNLFAVGGFYAVKGKLAALLSRFDLGEGGLIPLTVYKSDLVTPFEGDFFLLNFGTRKNSILPEQCDDARKFYIDKHTGKQIWDINYLNSDGRVALSAAALEGADLWFEETVHNRIFIKGELASALQEAELANDWRLHECQVGGER
jgi:hypothetical protein